MGRQSKRFRKIEQIVEKGKTYSLEEAIETLQKCPPVKFDQTVELSFVMGVDPRKSDQHIRGTVSLPNGRGKTIRVLVFAKGEKEQEAKDAGADYVGNEEFLQKVSGGWTDFDAVVSTPDMMRDVGKLGKVLGPRGLMPTPKAGTVSNDVAKAVSELKAGKIEFKLDRHGVINVPVGLLSFVVEKLAENIRSLVAAVQRAKPAAAKGIYIKSVSLSSTMGPGLKLEIREAEAS